jgi:hypothetical protein
MVGDIVKEVAKLLTITGNDQVHDIGRFLDALDECRRSDRRLLIHMLPKFSEHPILF